MVKTDACEDGMGAVLEQEQENGTFKTVVYWSSKFRKYENNYSVGEKKALACATAILNFKNYLLERKFTLFTDYKPLTTFMSQSTIKRTNAIVERWREKLAVFNYDVKHIKGSDNSVADWLSRSAKKVNHGMAPIYEEVVVNSIQKDTGAETVEYQGNLRTLVKIIDSNAWDKLNRSRFKEYHKHPSKLTTNKGRLFFDNCRFVPEESGRRKIISEAHEVHQGINRTKRRVEELFWWPGWGKDAMEFVNSCTVCKNSGRTKITRETQMVPVALPSGPWKKLAVDIKGPFKRTDPKYLLVVMDYYTKWPEVCGLKTITSTKVINCLDAIFRRFGLPNELVSDNGKQFTSKEFKRFTKNNGIEHNRVPVYNPQ